MATKTARNTAASARAGGYKPSGIGARARAVAAGLRNRTPEHLSGEQFGGGKHAAATPSYGANRANATGASNHAPSHGYNARHASGFESSGSSSGGRHAFSWFGR
jgi:hypothetical protein